MPLPKTASRLLGCGHAGGACLELYDAQSNELLCESCPVLGAAAPAEGAGPPVAFVAAMTRTELSPPRVLAPDQPLRLLSKYNASEGHSGTPALCRSALAHPGLVGWLFGSHVHIR